jgi:glycosyltransferase involved in cell wall biosynthesis
MKISVIMQSYLGDYPGARTFAREKFVRAVHSFIAQTHPDKELIIVADGCPFTRKIYELVYSSNPQIRLVWNDRQGANRTYDDCKGELYYRGKPKALGVQHATGDIIAYLDADDLYLPYYLEHLNAIWSDLPDKYVWASNAIRIMHIKNLKRSKAISVLHPKTVDLSAYGIHDDFIVQMEVSHGQVNCATSCTTHRRGLDVQWEDVVGKNEDVDFIHRLMQKYPEAAFRIEIPGYVVCHHRDGQWDC